MDLDFLKILGYGLSGFGFLLMFLAYKLIDKTIDKASTRSNKIIIFFMSLCLLMTLAVGVFTYITQSYKKEEIANVYNANDLLLKTQESNEISTSVLASENNSNPELKGKLKNKLDSLSTLVAESEDTSLNSALKINKRNLLFLYDSLQMSGLSNKDLNRIRLSYLKNNRSINAISKKVALEKIDKK